MSIMTRERRHMQEFADPIIDHQKYTLVSYIVPGYNCEESSRPGMMIRGSFPDVESAVRYAKSFKIKSFNTYAVETGKIIPSCPSVAEMDSVPAMYAEKELDDIMGGIAKRKEEADQAFEEHCATTRQKKSESPEDIRKSIEAVTKEIKDKEDHILFLKSELQKSLNRSSV